MEYVAEVTNGIALPAARSAESDSPLVPNENLLQDPSAILRPIASLQPVMFRNQLKESWKLCKVYSSGHSATRLRREDSKTINCSRAAAAFSLPKTVGARSASSMHRFSFMHNSALSAALQPIRI